jgi:hypothetical protein
MQYTLTFDENALSLILAGLSELPAKHSRELINGILQAKKEIEEKPMKPVKIEEGDGC